MNTSVIKSLILVGGLFLNIFPAIADVTKTVGSSGADYTTLKAAFDAINSGAINTGVITLQIINNTTETSSAVIYQSGYGGTSNYSAIHIYPTVTGKTITGNLDAALIDLNGADSVTIDGRLNATGSTKDLIITNTNTLSTAGTSTIRFLNDATNNIIKYTTLKGSSTDADAGILFFSTTTGTSGNDGNNIDNNSITNSADANRPINAIFSAGTASKENSGNTISSNYIYDFLKKGTASKGIQLIDHNTSWTITGNSFYETASFAPSASVEYSIIHINSPSGVSFTVSNNYIGGSAASCTGTWTKTNAFNNIFNGIYLNVGSTASSIQNNVIKNFNVANSASANWTAIHVAGGAVNLGTETGNTIGASTGTGSITVTNSTTGGTVYGINISGLNDINCQNNHIGSVTAANSNAANATNLYGIFKAATAGTTIFNNNTAGSTSTSNSLQTTSNADANPQWLCGIYSAGTGSTTISGNTIANMLNASINGTSNASTTTPMLNISCLRGILTIAGNNTIQNNIVHELSTAITDPDNYEDASLVGIAQIGISSASTQIISGNTVYNLTNTANTKIEMYGIFSKGAADGTSTIYKNFTHSFFLPSATTGSYLHGISLYAGVSIVSNNIVFLGNAISIGCFLFGIWKGSNNSMSIYHNTVYFNGTVTSTGNSGSFTFRDLSSAPDARNIRNNLFVNARTNSPSTTSGKNYTIYLASTGNLTLDYNNYWVSGIGGVLGSSGGDKTTLPIVTGQNAHSLNIDPLFMSVGTSITTNYKIKQQLQGSTDLLAAFPDDYGRINYRVTPTMGAWEQKNYWMGYTDMAWSKAENWTEGFVPLTGQNIIYCTVANYGTVAANDLLVDADYSIGSLTNATEKRLVIPIAKSLTANSTITTDGNPDRIYIQSGESVANGSLIFPNASNVYGSVEMYSKAAYNPGGLINNKYKWQFFGIPITSLIASPTFDGSWVRRYDETGTTISNHWIALTNLSDMTPLTGYEITQVTGRTILFRGNLVNTGFTRTLAFTAPTALYPGQHIFGNPYTAAIFIKQLIFGSQTEASVYLYNTGSFEDWTTNNGENIPGENPGQYTVAPKATAGDGGIPAQIPSMQGFLVKAMSSSTDATFQIPYNAVAVKNTDPQRAPSNQKSSSPDKVYTIIDVKGSRYSDRMWIFTDPLCTHNFDNGWDGYKMLGSTVAPQLFAMEEDGDYQVNSVNDMNDTYLGFQAGEDSLYTLTFTHDNIEKHYSELYLLDLNNNGITDIFQNGTSYSFTDQRTQTPEKRFKIIASQGSVTIDKTDLNLQTGIKIVCSRRMIIIHNFSPLDGILFLYDFSGRIIQKHTFTALGISKLPTPIFPGYYLVKAKTDSIEVNRPLVVR